MEPVISSYQDSFTRAISVQFGSQHGYSWDNYANRGEVNKWRWGKKKGEKNDLDNLRLCWSTMEFENWKINAQTCVSLFASSNSFFLVQKREKLFILPERTPVVSLLCLSGWDKAQRCSLLSAWINVISSHQRQSREPRKRDRETATKWRKIKIIKWRSKDVVRAGRLLPFFSLGFSVLAWCCLESSTVFMQSYIFYLKGTFNN